MKGLSVLDKKTRKVHNNWVARGILPMTWKQAKMTMTHEGIQHSMNAKTTRNKDLQMQISCVLTVAISSLWL